MVSSNSRRIYPQESLIGTYQTGGLVGHRAPAVHPGSPSYDSPVVEPLAEYRLSYSARQID